MRRQDDEMMYDLEKRFDRHLEIYASNGKEMARLAMVVERMEERSHKRDKQVNEMFDVYKDFKSGKKVIVWFVGGAFALFMSVGGAYLMAKNILR